MKIINGLILIACLILIVGCNSSEQSLGGGTFSSEETFIGTMDLDTTVCTATNRCGYRLLLVESDYLEGKLLKFNSDDFLGCEDVTVKDQTQNFGFRVVGKECDLGFGENQQYKLTGKLEYDSIKEVNYIKIKKYEEIN
jgi:hypothetical protein